MNCYQDKKGWIAYTQLFWHRESKQLEEVINRLVNDLPSSNTSKPIYVLVLGMGCGTFELPFLLQLKKATGREIRIVGIDSSKESLYFTSKLLEEGLDNLPSSVNDKVKKLQKHNWEEGQKVFTEENNYLQIDHHLLIWDDLDFDNVAHTKEKYPILLNGVPSQWKQRLTNILEKQQDFFVPLKDGFDLVINPFCLHHLTWWRYALMSALSLMKEKGIFLFAWLEGDAEIMQGNLSSSPRILKEEGINNYPYNSRMFWESCTEFFEYFKTNHKIIPQPVGSVYPFELSNFLDFLKNYGLEKIRQPNLGNYLIFNEANKNVVIDLMESKFCCPFRRLANNIGLPKYEDIIQKIRNKIDKKYLDNDSDHLLFQCFWSAYQVKNKEQLLESFISQMFTQSNSIKNSAIAAQERLKELDNNYYQILEATKNFGLSQSLEERKLTNGFAKFVNETGMLYPSCFGGFIRYHGEKIFENPMFLNYLHKNKLNWQKYAKSIWINMLMRKPEFTQQEFSNTQSLVNLTQITGKPIRIIYRYDTEFDFIDDRLIDIKVINCLSGINLEYILNHKKLKSIKEFEKELGKPINYPIKFKQRTKFIYECDYTELTLETKNAINQIRQKIHEYVQQKNIIEQTQIIIEQEIGSCSQEFREKLKSTIHLDWAEKAIWATNFLDYSFVVFYPIIYYLDRQVEADDVILEFYDSELTAELFYEQIDRIFLFNKQIDRIFKINNLLCETFYTDDRKEEESKEEAFEQLLSSFSHEVSKISSSIQTKPLVNLSDLFQIQLLSQNNDILTWNLCPKPEYASYIKDIELWKICPNPTLFNDFNLLLFLWAGSRESISSILPNDPKSLTLFDILDYFAKKARELVAKSKMVSILVSPVSLILLDSVVQKKYPKIPEIKIDMDTVSHFQWKDSEVSNYSDQEKNDMKKAQTNFIRLILAVFMNAIEHSPELSGIKCSITQLDDKIKLTIRNKPKDTGNGKTFRQTGTQAVINLCLTSPLLKGKLDYFGFEPDNNFFKTELTLSTIHIFEVK